MLSLTSCSGQEWQPRESIVGLIKMSSLLAVVAVAVLMLQYNWTLFLPHVNTEKVDLGKWI